MDTGNSRRSLVGSSGVSALHLRYVTERSGPVRLPVTFARESVCHIKQNGTTSQRWAKRLVSDRARSLSLRGQKNSRGERERKIRAGNNSSYFEDVVALFFVSRKQLTPVCRPERL